MLIPFVEQVSTQKMRRVVRVGRRKAKAWRERLTATCIAKQGQAWRGGARHRGGDGELKEGEGASEREGRESGSSAPPTTPSDWRARTASRMREPRPRRRGRTNQLRADPAMRAQKREEHTI
eukprot:6189279-Pleurochrysis_carterae.AAC.1